MPDETSKLRCTATTRSGRQCRALALPGVDYCALHSPQAVEGRKRGGVNHSAVRRGLKLMPPDLREVADLVAVAIRQVYDGDLDPKQLTSMSAGTAALCRVLEVALLRSELEALRAQVDELVVLRQAEGARRP